MSSGNPAVWTGLPDQKSKISLSEVQSETCTELVPHGILGLYLVIQDGRISCVTQVLSLK
jgi:hypothetical protein